MSRWRLLVRLDEPLIIAERAAAGNRFQSRNAIPGTVLRGALANRAAQRFNLSDADTYRAFLYLFLRDGVYFPTLYPLQAYRTKKADGEKEIGYYPAIPTPRDAFACQVHTDHPMMWGTAGEGEKCIACEKALQKEGKACAPGICKTKAARGQFYPLPGNASERFWPEKRVEMHIRVDPDTGRVIEGQLFDYVPLEAGQYFMGELQCADKETWDLLQSFTGITESQPVTMRLGKAIRRGYGKVTLWLEPLQDKVSAEDKKVPATLWEIVPFEKRVPEGTSELTLTLLTDTVIQDDWGRFATGFDVDWLNEIFKEQEASADKETSSDITVQIVEGRDFAGRRITDGYNTQWHLPRWRVAALTAGSSVRLHLESPLDFQELKERLKKLEQEGIGARRNEGYGKIVFNHPLYTGFPDVAHTRVDIPDALQLIGPEEATRRDLRVAWREKLDGLVTEHKQQWRRLRGESQPLTALARWLMQNHHRDVAALIEEITAFGVADEALKTLIQEQGDEGTTDEYGARPQKNRLEEIKAISLVKQQLRDLHTYSPSFWPDGIRMLADQLAELAEMEKET